LIDGQTFVIAAAESAAHHLAWSADSTQIAYLSYLDDDSTEIRVVSASGGTPRVVLRKPDGDFHYEALAWHADGKSLVLQISRKRTDDFGTVSLDTGETRVFKTIQKEPNSRDLAWILSADRTSVTLGRSNGANRDIFSVELDTGRETPLVSHAADDTPL